ncbi:histidine--tRNA ligase [Bacillus massiliglaciei]|uniref:histidine--tRNA ligase n=1 Tax=Bacillus massiliglaciei TaxID=1816693 RepID=UPI000AC48FA2|nr:histidine--tRNA ligase [Bacillus massiliglaciei]
MKKMKDQNVKGTQDYLPEAELVRRDIRRTLEEVFSLYGCKPLETPILHYTELLASKYGGGSEILKEMYTLTDRGNRDLSLRYDLTIPFAKVVAMNPAIRLPFKRYEIGKVFRDGPIKTGRLREFTQCDVDIAGVDSVLAEAELMKMAADVFQRLDLDVKIQLNNRKLLTGLLEDFEIPMEKRNPVILILDKLEKAGRQGVTKELEELGLTDSAAESITHFLNAGSFNYFLPFAEQNDQIKQGLEEMKELETYLSVLGIKEQCVFNPYLARGLDIYTGTIYEIFLADRTITSSIGSGGRYDQAIGGLLGTSQTFSTVGISFGLDVIFNAVQQKKELSSAASYIDYYIIPIGTRKEAFAAAADLRDKGFKVEMEMRPKKLAKSLDYANKANVRNVVIIGEEEVKNSYFKVKDMMTGEERNVSFSFTSL